MPKPNNSETHAESAVLNLDDPLARDLAVVGGKGANLAILRQAEIKVPEGFCVSTVAYSHFVRELADFDKALEKLDAIPLEQNKSLSAQAEKIRKLIQAQEFSKDLAQQILQAWTKMDQVPCAVRSSATAEDLPDASFAGQQDTYLNVCSEADLLDKVRSCWASLFTERAVIYRIQNNIKHAEVQLAVVVQAMVQAERSGIMFTADPLSGHRGLLSIDAGWGLGEALVSGTVSADLYKINKDSGELGEFKAGQQEHAIVSQKDGGTSEKKLSKEKLGQAVLDDKHQKMLLQAAKQIEDLYKQPQDIEWCFVDEALYILQSRPITTLYPLPDKIPDANSNAVLMCVNHLQVMTDAMPPMAHDVVKIFLPLGRSFTEQQRSPWMVSAGGRVFIDLQRPLRMALSRKMILKFLGIADLLTQSGIKELASRPNFQKGPKVSLLGLLGFALPMLSKAMTWLLWRNPKRFAALTLERHQQYFTELRARVQSGRGIEQRLALARKELYLLFTELVSIPPALLAGLLGFRLGCKLSQASAADQRAMERGLVGNVTTDMDLAVGDMADALRTYQKLSDAIINGETDLAKLQALPGGDKLRKVLDQFLSQYGMRGPSEFDISRPRWRDDPRSLLSTLASSLGQKEARHHRRQHDALRDEAEQVLNRLVKDANKGLLGPLRSMLVNRFLRLGRELMAIREHPKFLLMRCMGLFRELVLEAGERLRARGAISSVDDVWFTDSDELLAALENESHDLRDLVKKRRQLFAQHQKLRPPRVMTETGEIPQLRYAEGDYPEGALIGAGVSAGQIEGIARVIHDPSTESLQAGEILVAHFTDPGWTPLFINAAGLVMEVGGMMTHGSVVAREYGIPAVVGVLDAIERISSGMRIRVDGAAGFVQILDDTKEPGEAAQVDDDDNSAAEHKA